ncbi:hypothetical protein AgCh_004660 [Apium graveolens]
MITQQHNTPNASVRTCVASAPLFSLGTNTNSNTVTGDYSTENTVGNPIEVDGSEKPSKRPKSKVWDHFTKYNDANGKLRSLCKHCKKNFVGESNQGTSHLANHLKRCTAKIYNDAGQKSIFAAMKKSEGPAKVDTFKFDQHKSRKDLTTMIIKHNYPFCMVDHEFFEYFCNGLNPEFNLISRNTVKSDIIKLHEEMKVKIYEVMDGLDCRVTHTTDIWTSDAQNFAYACLTTHYIDDEWELQKKILNYRIIGWPHDGESLFRFISQLIMDWNLDKKLFAMVVDNASSNDSMVNI